MTRASPVALVQIEQFVVPRGPRLFLYGREILLASASGSYGREYLAVRQCFVALLCGEGEGKVKRRKVCRF